MKRIVAIFLSLLLIISAVPMATAETVYWDDKQVSFDLSVDGEHVVTAETDDVITVTYTLKNVTSPGEAFIVESITNEICFDREFFELDVDSIEKTFADYTTGVHDSMTQGRKIYYNSFHIPGRSYAGNQVVGTFDLKVLATSGQSTLSSVGITAFYGGKCYQMTTEDLTVMIGDDVPETYTVTYMNNGSVYKTVQAVGDMTVDYAPTPAPERHTFAGWECDGTLYQPGDTFAVTGDVTFTAQWTEIAPIVNHTLTFETNGGSAISPVTRQEGTIINLSDYVTEKTGYTFQDWYLDADFNDKVTVVTLTDDITVYAKWKKDAPGGGGGGGAVSKYTITFKDIDGTLLGTVEKNANSVVDLSQFKYTKAGYLFDGWYTDEALTNKVTSIELKKSITLYAKWTQDGKPNYHPDILTTEHYAYVVGREGNMIAPNANITRAEVATIFFRLLTEEVRTANITRDNVFTDVNEGAWFNTAVSTLARLGIINGRTADTFAPTANITRAEFTTIAARFSDVVYEGENLFSDIDGHWAKNYINTAASIGWVVGENGIFRPGDNITRAEVMTLVNRVLNRMPESEADLLDGMNRWVDNADPDVWYYLAVQEATNSHDYVMKSDGVHETWTKLTETPDWAEFEK